MRNSQQHPLEIELQKMMLTPNATKFWIFNRPSTPMTESDWQSVYEYEWMRRLIFLVVMIELRIDEIKLAA